MSLFQFIIKYFHHMIIFCKIVLSSEAETGAKMLYLLSTSNRDSDGFRSQSDLSLGGFF